MQNAWKKLPGYDEKLYGVVLLSDGQPDKHGSLDPDDIMEQQDNIRTLVKRMSIPIVTVTWRIGGSYDVADGCARNKAYAFMKDIAGLTNCGVYAATALPALNGQPNIEKGEWLQSWSDLPEPKPNKCPRLSAHYIKAAGISRQATGFQNIVPAFYFSDVDAKPCSGGSCSVYKKDECKDITYGLSTKCKRGDAASDGASAPLPFETLAQVH